MFVKSSRAMTGGIFFKDEDNRVKGHSRNPYHGIFYQDYRMRNLAATSCFSSERVPGWHLYIQLY
jgi:hypothetical protein